MHMSRIFTAFHNGVAPSTVLPPVVVEGPSPNVFYSVGDRIILPCKAQGNPPPRQVFTQAQNTRCSLKQYYKMLFEQSIVMTSEFRIENNNKIKSLKVGLLSMSKTLTNLGLATDSKLRNYYIIFTIYCRLLLEFIWLWMMSDVQKTCSLVLPMESVFTYCNIAHRQLFLALMLSAKVPFNWMFQCTWTHVSHRSCTTNVERVGQRIELRNVLQACNILLFDNCSIQTDLFLCINCFTRIMEA